jgi:large subunit ribosomal protein L25
MAQPKRPQLSVEERPERGTRAVRRLRREGYVPGVVYGGGNDTTAFKVNARVLRHALHEGSAVLDLSFDGKARPVILKDEQRHAFRDETLHIDFLEVNLNEKIQTTVAVELEGGEESPGAKEGGVIEHVTRELNIEALPTDIPERITVDVSGLEAAATMTLSEISPPRGVTFLDDPEETVIATVTVPTEIEEPEEVEEETELVGEEGEAVEAAEGEEAEAQAEGATAEEAEAGAGSGGEES